MKKDEELYHVILDEIARLTKILHSGGCTSVKTIELFSYTINKLVFVLKGELSIDDFHDSLADAPKCTREYYYKLLYQEKV